MMHAIAIPHVLLVVLLSHPVANYHMPAIGTASTVDTSLHFTNVSDCDLAKSHVRDALDAQHVEAVVECIPLHAGRNLLADRRR
jgi:hypothetical protein